MKQKDGFRIRMICGENILVAEGENNIDFTNIIGMNETSAYLWEKLRGREFDVNDMVKELCSEYNVDEKQAAKDCENLLLQWKEARVIDE